MFNYKGLILISILSIFSFQSLAFAQSHQNNSIYSKLTQVFEPDIQGSTIAYLETILGPAKKIDKYSDDPSQSFRYYQVGPCQVVATGTDTVINIKLEQLSNDCTFDFQKFITGSDSSGPVNVFGMTFNDLNEVLGYSYQFIRDCIYMCGKAQTPKIGFAFEPNFPGQSNVSAWFNLNLTKPDKKGRDPFGQLQILKDYLINTQGGDTVALIEYIVTPEANELAWESLKDVYLDTIMIGQNIE
jgi:hypothetical protein